MKSKEKVTKMKKGNVRCRLTSGQTSTLRVVRVVSRVYTFEEGREVNVVFSFRLFLSLSLSVRCLQSLLLSLRNVTIVRPSITSHLYLASSSPLGTTIEKWRRGDPPKGKKEGILFFRVAFTRFKVNSGSRRFSLSS